MAVRGNGKAYQSVGWIIVIALLGGHAAPAAASQVDDAAREGEAQIQTDGEKFDISSENGFSSNMWMWRKGRRAYTVTQARTKTVATGYDATPSTGQAQNQMIIVSRDLDTGNEVARRVLDRPWAGERAHSTSQALNKARHFAVDEDGGRLFVPFRYSGSGGPFRSYEAAQQQGRCAHVGHTEFHTCVAGIIVLDAETLDELGRIDLNELTVDGGLLLGPQLMAMSYAPPSAAGDPGKVLMLVRDSDTWELGDVNGVLHYVVQLDPAERRVDWTVRAEGCRSNRTPQAHSPTSEPGRLAEFWRRLNEAVVFRAGTPEAPVVWVGCYQTNRTAAIVKIPLDEDGFPAAVPYRPGDPGAAAGTAADDPRAVKQDDVVKSAPAAGQEVHIGPKEVREYLADPASERILARVYENEAEVWWVFDGRKNAFLGTIGIGRYPFGGTVSGLDPSSGRFYVLAPKVSASASGSQLEGGLFVVDVRRTPVPQALVFPEFARMLQPQWNVVPIQVDYGNGAPETPRRLFVRKGDICCLNMPPTYADLQSSGFWTPFAYDVMVDPIPGTVDPEVDLFAGRSVDLDEIEGVTQASYDAAARGFAARALFIGGLTAQTRVGPVDPTTYDDLSDPEETGANVSECRRSGRQVVVGFVGPRDAAVVDGNGSRGGAEAVVVDSGTRGDAQLPVSRCGVRVDQEFTGVGATTEWDSLWSTGLFSRPPVGEPSVPWQFGDGDVSCVSSDEEPSASFGDPVTGLFASRVECGADEASGFGYARGVGAQGMNVSEAVSKFRIYRDPGRGIVSRVESIARGIDLGGVVRIDTVRGVAESWANGRAQFVGDADRDAGYDPNCDFERTAGTCFSRSIFGVKTPVYSCGPCGDEKRLVDAISKAMGGNARVRLRDPDETLRKGAPNGYIAAIQKPAHERFGDVVLNDDLLQTVVPVLEIIRYAPTGLRVDVGSGDRGLQVYQFAGVEVSSSYGIQCLLVFDPEHNTCGAALEPPGGITVSLTDPAGKGLAGGGFEVRTDVDTDGVVGLKDTLLPDGACVTADDGIGTCKFDNLQPGSYLVSQVAAPPGFGKVADPFVVELASGEARTVTFVNSSSVSTINVSAADEAGKPVSGAQFAVYPDADSDGKVAADAEPAATCTTDASGSCSMGVPAGSYVLVQTGAPGGLEPIEPVAFTFASGGQTAAVGVVNYPAGSLPQPEAAAAPIYSDAPPSVVTETVTGYTLAEEPAVADAPVSVPEVVGGTIVRVIQAPGDALRLLARDPKQAAAWTASLLLFALAFLAIRRRQQATALIGS